MDLFTIMMLFVSFSLEDAMFIPIFESNNPVPVREESLILSCFPTAIFNTGTILWYHPSGTVLARCLPIRGGACDNNITYTANITGSYAFINSLNRTRDSGLWQCEYTTGGKLSLTIIVYASPVDVKLAPSLLPVTDLGMGSLTLKCQTVNCTYPAPNITWYIYNMTSAQIAPYTGSSSILESDTSPCIEQEAIYTNTLHLPHGTTFQENIPVTTKFLCGLEHPTLGQTAKYSQNSSNVTFAVNLTHIKLKDVIGTELLGSVEVVQGTQVTFVCITSVSRPTATVNWYIGDTQINDYITSRNETGDYGMQFVESRLTFIPSDMEHHNKRMYCRAYSYNNSIIIMSSEALLFVKVNVAQAVIQQSNHTLTEILNATTWEPVTLTCVTAFSRPAPTIDWYIEYQWKGNGTSLTFTASNEDHNKTIYCKAYNIDPSRPVSSKKAGLYVKISVTAMTLENSTTGTFVFYDGFSQTLKCTSSPSRPSAAIKWMLELQTQSVQLTDNITNTDVTNVHGLFVRTSEITLTLKKENRNQKIFCIGNIDGQQIAAVSSKVTIDVWYQPNKPKVQEYGTYFPWLESQDGTLKCNSSDYGNPTSNVSWTSNRGITDANGHLVIIGLAWSDHRNLVSCQLVNRYTIDKDMHAVSESINLNVEYSPRIQFNTTSPLTVNETQFLSVSCSASGNPNPNQIFWSVRPDGSLLRFENISRNDNGTYMCKATANSAKHGTLKNQMEFNIIVQYAPVIKVTDVSSTHQNMTSLITCEAIGFPAVYTFYPWKHMWGETTIRYGLQGIPTGSTSTSQNILKLERLSLQDMGTYVCSAENRIKGINGEFIQIAAVDLNIMGIPAFLHEETNKFAGEIGLFINISIPFYSYSNVTSFMFKKNGALVLNTNRTSTHLTNAIIDYILHDRKIQLRAQEAYLYIQNLTKEDFDNYTLILENSQGPAEFILTLDPIGPPLMVLRFYLNRVGDQIELHFDPGFNGGRIQVFVIQYKSETDLEDWKNASILQETLTQYRLPNGTFAVNVTKPSPGSYIYRMYSWNEIDRSPYSYEIKVFIPEAMTPDSSSTFSLPAVAGGIGAGVMVILMAVVALFLWRRYHHHSQHTDGTQINQINAKSVRHDAADGQDYEGLHINNTEASEYLQLNGRFTFSIMGLDISDNISISILRPPENDSYEKLHPYTNNDIQMYSSLKIPKIATDSEKVYENTRIKATDLTAEHQ